MELFLHPIYSNILNYLSEHPDSCQEEVEKYLASIPATAMGFIRDGENATEVCLDDLETLQLVTAKYDDKLRKTIWNSTTNLRKNT